MQKLFLLLLITSMAVIGCGGKSSTIPPSVTVIAPQKYCPRPMPLQVDKAIDQMSWGDLAELAVMLDAHVALQDEALDCYEKQPAKSEVKK